MSYYKERIWNGDPRDEPDDDADDLRLDAENDAEMRNDDKRYDEKD